MTEDGRSGDDFIVNADSVRFGKEGSEPVVYGVPVWLRLLRVMFNEKNRRRVVKETKCVCGVLMPTMTEMSKEEIRSGEVQTHKCSQCQREWWASCSDPVTAVRYWYAGKVPWEVK